MLFKLPMHQWWIGLIAWSILQATLTNNLPVLEGLFACMAGGILYALVIGQES